MMIPRPSEITPHHLSRMAVVYIRLTLRPERSAEWGAIDAQRAQVKHARSWGWPKGLIVVIDEDIGRPGSVTTVASGFRRLCQMIEADDVGIVLISDLARLSRSRGHLVDFLSLCGRKDVLVALDGILVDPSTISLRDSSPVQVARNSGRTAYQQRPSGWRAVQLARAAGLKIRESFRRFLSAGKGDSEIAEEFHKRGGKTI